MRTDPVPSTGVHPTDEAAPPAMGRLVRLPAVLGRVAVGRSVWWQMVRDGRAPQPIHIGRAAFWVESELSAWIEQRIRAARTRR